MMEREGTTTVMELLVGIPFMTGQPIGSTAVAPCAESPYFSASKATMTQRNRCRISGAWQGGYRKERVL